MKILCACEESQAVTSELRKLGHEAYSCDILETSGTHPEYHIKQDVIPLLQGWCFFRTQDGEWHTVNQEWDMIIAFPPCTYLTVAGNRWFNIEKYGEKAFERIQKRYEAINFFLEFVNASCAKIAIENPIGIMSTMYRKPDQIIHPWQYGHGETKATCIWLKGLPKLVPTDIVEGREQRIWKMPPCENRAKLRSKTFPGIAKAMAEQWAGYCE